MASLSDDEAFAAICSILDIAHIHELIVVSDDHSASNLFTYIWIIFEFTPAKRTRKLPLEQPTHMRQNPNIPQILRFNLDLNINQSILRLTNNVKLCVSFVSRNDIQDLVIMKI